MVFFWILFFFLGSVSVNVNPDPQLIVTWIQICELILSELGSGQLAISIHVIL